MRLQSVVKNNIFIFFHSTLLENEIEIYYQRRRLW